MADGTVELDTELVAIPRDTALQVFTTKLVDGKHPAFDPILAKVREAIEAFEVDLTTSAGRKACASMAMRVSKSKVAIEKVGKELADEQKNIPKLIDASRNYVKTVLDAWRDEVRQPLTEWEKVEEARVAKIKSELAAFENFINDHSERSSVELQGMLDALKVSPILETFYAEYAGAAQELKDKAVAALEMRLPVALKREADAAELAKLRAEADARAKADAEAKAEQDRKDHERRIADAAVAAERAKADEAIRLEREAAAKREQELKDAVAEVERKGVEAARKAKAEADAEAAERAKRESDKAHKASINRAAMQALIKDGIAEDVAKKVIVLIARGAVPACSIAY